MRIWERLRKFLRNLLEGTALAGAYRAARADLGFSRQRFVRTPDGYLFAGRADMQSGIFECEEVKVIRQYLDKADVLIDVGANVGYYCCVACAKGRKVVAVEPVPENLRYLCANLRVNGWADEVEVFPVGLAAAPGLADLYGAGTGASLVRGWAGTSPRFAQTIALSTLDILLGERFAGKKLVIKVDVEGAEYAALRGASRTLQMSPRPVWLVEITLSEHRQGSTNPYFLNTFELFWQYGYEARTADGSNRQLSRSDILALNESGHVGAEIGNYLFHCH